MYPLVSFGVWLQKRRRALDLTQAELAQLAGCSVSALRKIEADERRPSKQLAGLLADCLEIPLEDKPNFIKIARGEMLLERLNVAGTSTNIRSLLTPKSQPAQANLPSPSTPFIGRQAELSVMEQLLRDPQCRLLTIAGLGGMGKTRLAIEAASKNQSLYTDGVYFVQLSSLQTPERIIPAIGEVLDFTIANQPDPKLQLFNYLREKHLLLVLDNFEHLLEGVELLAEILQHAAQVKLIVTTRDRLNLQGEWVLEIQGLQVPNSREPEAARSYSSFNLFVQSAQRLRGDFVVNPDEHSWVIRICQLVQGMPLGIELAAAWVHVLTCREIAQEIERDLGFLTSNMRDIPERQRSLRVVLEASWRRLSAEEQRVLSRLSVFRGGFTRSAAEQIAGADLMILSTLMARSLLSRSASDRYDLHELVRQFAAERLREAGELEPMLQQHLEYYLQLAVTAEIEFEGPHLNEWRDRMVQESDNLLEALNWALKNDAELGLHLVSSLSVMHEDIWLLGTERERRQWVGNALLAAENSPKPVSAGARAKALFRAAILEPLPGKAKSLLQESITLAREAGDKRTLAYALSIASSYEYKDNFSGQGEAYFQESLNIFQELNNKFGVAHILLIRSIGERLLGNYQKSIELCESSLILARELKHDPLATINVANLIALAIRMGDLSRAKVLLDDCQEQYLKARNDLGMGDVLFQRGRVSTMEGDYNGAVEYIDKSLAIALDRENAALQCVNYMLLGDISYYQNDLESALQHYDTALNCVDSAVGFGPPWVLKPHILIGDARIDWVKGNYESAVGTIEQVLGLLQTTHDAWSHALALYTLGRVELSRGNMIEAEENLQKCLVEMHQLNDRLGLAKCLEALAMVAVAGRPDRYDYSVRLFAAADDLRQSMGVPIPPVECDEYDRHLTSVRSRLDEADFANGWAEGKALVSTGVDAAVNYARMTGKAPVHGS
jgi:predicted ATPase/tetratricopeptide (TPR) repeat protein/transcriptional regulator with XRE-family HTH domain